MAMQCDRPSYSLTNEDINEINTAIKEHIAGGNEGDYEFESPREEGFLKAAYYADHKQVCAYFEWADRDGDADYFDLEDWTLED